MKTIPTWLWLIGGIAALLALSAGGVVAVNYFSAAWLASSNGQKWAPILAAAETQFSIPPGLLARIAYQETHFVQAYIDGTKPSSAGALGIMQLEPADFSTVNRPIPFSEQDTTDQIQQAAGELARLFGVFGDWTTTVAAYNDGEGNINKVLAGTKTLPSQTATYLQQVSADLPDIVNPTLQA